MPQLWLVVQWLTNKDKHILQCPSNLIYSTSLFFLSWSLASISPTVAYICKNFVYYDDGGPAVLLLADTLLLRLDLKDGTGPAHGFLEDRKFNDCASVEVVTVANAMASQT
jgi:hypothetical protein